MDIMIHFNTVEMNCFIINKRSQVSFIMKSLPKSSPVQEKRKKGRSKCLLKSKGKKGEVNVTTSQKFVKGSSSKDKFGLSILEEKSISIDKKGKVKDKTTTKKEKLKVPKKGKCHHCNKDEHQKRNYPKYLSKLRAKNVKQGKYDLLVKTCLVENHKSTQILD